MKDWGFVYVLANRYMPGVVKVGKTTRTPHQRAEELSTTGVPGDFDVAFAVETSECSFLESDVHRELQHLRVDGKEFFRCSPGCAVSAIRRVSHDSRGNIFGCPDVLNEHLDDYCEACLPKASRKDPEDGGF